MALKMKITKAAYEKLSDELKDEYKADGDAHYKLDVTGIDDPAELRRAKERAEADRDELRDEVKELKKTNKELEASQTDEGKDIAKVEARYQRRLATIEEENQAKIKDRDTFIRELLVDNQASSLATAISTVPALMTDVLKKRLDVDFTGEKPALVVLGKDGKADPAMTIDKLKAEVLANPEYKPILTGSKATGSATPKGPMPAAGATPATEDANINTLSGKDFVARVKAKADASKQAGATG